MTASDPATLQPGTEVQVIKLHPDGREAARYEAVVVEDECPSGWFALRATWTNRSVAVHGLKFETGDTLIELFSSDEWFNAFRVQSPGGEIRGWYANVTYPTSVDRAGETTTVTWHDLYLDVIRLADGTVTLRDEDELAASGLAERDPELHARIERTARVMLALAKACVFPFHQRH